MDLALQYDLNITEISNIAVFQKNMAESMMMNLKGAKLKDAYHHENVL